MSDKSYSDWLPRKHEKLYSMLVAIIAYLTAGVLERLGIVSSESNPPSVGEHRNASSWFQTVFMPAYLSYAALYGNFMDLTKRTPVLAQDFYAAEALIISLLRQLYMGFIRNNVNATDSDRVAMGFPILKKTRTDAPKPKEVPEADVTHPSVGILEINVHTPDGSSRPNATTHGFEVRGAIANSPILDGEWQKFDRSYFSTTSPLIISDLSSFIGKIFYFAVRWENTTGEKGPWSQVYSVMIS